MTREEFIKRIDGFNCCPSYYGLKDTMTKCEFGDCHECHILAIKNIKFKGEDEVKSYTNSEVMEMLKHNSALKFEHENKDINVKMIISANKIGYINLRCEGCRDGMDGNIKLTDEWQLVQQPVSFMEAVNSGKKIMREGWRNYIEIDNVFEAMSRRDPSVIREMINGKWYIKDGE